MHSTKPRNALTLYSLGVNAALAYHLFTAPPMPRPAPVLPPLPMPVVVPAQPRVIVVPVPAADPARPEEDDAAEVIPQKIRHFV